MEIIECRTKVAILMATYNGERFLKSQIDSIISQSYNDWTLYICDDGSSDATVSIIKEYCSKHNRIILVPKTHNKRGACANFMELLKKVESRFYMFCDQDDVWLSDKIQRTIGGLNSKDLELPIAVCTDLTLVNTDLEVLHKSMWDFAKLRPKYLCKWRYLSTCNILTGCTMLINHRAKEVSVKGYDKALMHDSWIGLKCLANGGEIICIDKPTILYRQHGFNVLGSPQKVSLHYYLKRLVLIKEVLKNTIDQYQYVNQIKRSSFIAFIINKAAYSLLRIK